MTVGERIQKARKAAKLSQKELGEKLGVSASMIGQYENNLRNPKTETLFKIAEALDVSPRELGHDHVFFFTDYLVLEEENMSNALISAFQKLNVDGQQKAIERVQELSEIPKYKKEENE